MLPERDQFPTQNGYYKTALHECGHATGHPDRLNRETLKEGIANGFGSPEYAREELRAEISAMMTGERVGVGHDPQRGAAYVENWVKVLEKDPHEIHRAARDAQKMTDHLMERAINREVATPSEEKSRAQLTDEYSQTRGQEINQHRPIDIHSPQIKQRPTIDIPPPAPAAKVSPGIQRAQQAEDREKFATIERHYGPQRTDQPTLPFKHGPPKTPDRGPSR